MTRNYQFYLHQILPSLCPGCVSVSVIGCEYVRNVGEERMIVYKLTFFTLAQVHIMYDIYTLCACICRTLIGWSMYIL